MVAGDPRLWTACIENGTFKSDLVLSREELCFLVFVRFCRAICSASDKRCYQGFLRLLSFEQGGVVVVYEYVSAKICKHLWSCYVRLMLKWCYPISCIFLCKYFVCEMFLTFKRKFRKQQAKPVDLTQI